MLSGSVCTGLRLGLAVGGLQCPAWLVTWVPKRHEEVGWLCAVGWLGANWECVCEEEVFALVFVIFLFLRSHISNLPLQLFTCWLVPILQMLPCHRGNISPEIISMAVWHSLCKLHLAVAYKIVCRNHLALIKSLFNNGTCLLLLLFCWGLWLRSVALLLMETSSSKR